MPHHVGIPDAWSEKLFRLRWFLLLGFAVLTALSCAAALRAPVRASILHGLTPNDQHIRDRLRHASVLGGGSDDLLFVATVEREKLFTPQTLNAIRRAAREMEQNRHIESVISIVDAPRLTTGEGSLMGGALRASVRDLLRQGKTPPVNLFHLSDALHWPRDPLRQRKMNMADVQKAMLDDPLTRRLLSDDGPNHVGAQLMIVKLADSAALHDRPQTGMREEVESILRRQGLGRYGVYCTGTLVVQDWMFVEVIRAFTVVLPIGALIVCVLVYFIFRRLSYVALTLIIAGIAICWALGAVSLVFGEITLLVAAAPPLILVMSTADTVHLLSAYVEELRQGRSQHEAVRRVFSHVGGACILTSITTMVGFLSLMVVPAASLRHMCVACAVGVASALILALTLVPLALTVLPLSVERLNRPSRLNQSLSWVAAVCRRLSLSFPRTVVFTLAVVIGLCVWAAVQIRCDADLPSRFPQQHPLRQSVRFFNQHLRGVSTIEILIRTDPDQMLSRDVLEKLAGLERRITEQPDVRDVISLATLFRAMDRVIDFPTPKNGIGGLPESSRQAAACLRLARKLQSGAVQAVVSEKEGLTRIVVRVASTRVLHVLEIAQQIQRMVEAELPAPTEVQLVGYYPIVGAAVRKLLVSQLYGFLLCFVCVMAVLTIGVRSLRLGLLSVAPNLFPLLLLGGILGVGFEMVDVDLMGVAIISLGLAVDDTIHFLHRYDVERSAGPKTLAGRRRALERTFGYTGDAIIRTTFILGLGLLPFGFSQYLSIHVLGVHLVLVLVGALFGDLLLLPSLMMMFPSKKATTRLRAGPVNL